MSNWNGAFYKHRDYEHDTVFEHLMDDGGFYVIDDVVYCDVDPVTGDLLSPPQIYYAVDINASHFRQAYTYLIPAESDNSGPNRTTVRDTMQAYVETPVDGGRRVTDFLDDEMMIEEEERLDELRRKLNRDRRN